VKPSDDLADILAQMENDTLSAPATSDTTERDTADRATSGPAAATATGGGGRLTDPRDLERPSRASDVVIESEGGIHFDPSFASFGKRILELIIDTIVLCLVVLPGLVIAAIAGSLWFVGLLVSLFGFVSFVAFTARSIAATGQSLGNRVADTRVVDGINGVNIDLGRAALRVTVRHLISTILLIGFLIAFTDSQRRTFHDRVARTVVVGREREVWTAD
jgi:uncharacterized RDD family membrane protein YckC